MTFNFEISNNSLTLTSKPAVFSGSENYYLCKFDFLTSDWDNLSKLAVFTSSETAVSVPVTNNECFIPAEILSSEGSVCIGVFGTNGQEDDYLRISTGLVYLSVGEGAYRDAVLPAVPTPDLWEKYYAEITRVDGFAQRAENAATAAEQSSENAEKSNISATQALSDLLRMLGTDIATLIDGKIPVSQIPSIATTEIYSASSAIDMAKLSVQNGDICIRTDENKSYIYNNGWVFLVSPTDYASMCGYAEFAGTAENTSMINHHRLIEMTAEEFETAVKDPNTYYLVY